MNKEAQDQYIKLLHTELVPALGCTEPIAIAYAAAVAAHTLGETPTKLIAKCSPNIIKNVKSVVVPNSNGMKGIAAATVLGAFDGNPDKKLEVLVDVKKENLAQYQALIDQGICDVELLESPVTLHIIVIAESTANRVSVEIKESHTNIVSITKNDQVIYSHVEPATLKDDSAGEPLQMNIDDIIDFAKSCPIDAICELLDQQINCNTRISQEGLSQPYGACIGRTILATDNNCIKTRAKAFAAAGSDARMGGCDLPVIINSGSGNQGLSVSIPVIEYAKELGVTDEIRYRALLLSNLVALYQKTYIGKLSAYCGAVCASTGSGAAITYMKNGTIQQIKDTIINSLAITSGVVCDGAKASCAGKIATSVETAVMAHEMAMAGNVFAAGDGIVKGDVDQTIQMVGRLADKGMRSTDKEILNIMLEK